MNAGAWPVAWLGGATASAANAGPERAFLQLLGRDGPREENAGDQHAQERCLDLLAHNRSPFVRGFGLVLFGLQRRLIQLVLADTVRLTSLVAMTSSVARRRRTALTEAGKCLGLAPHLSRRNRPGAQNRHDDRSQQCVLDDFWAH